MKLLFLGDVVGSGARNFIMQNLSQIRIENAIDLVIVNGENSAGGNGITKRIADGFFNCGVDVITTGDHCWDQRSLLPDIDTLPRLLRPANYPDYHNQKTPGNGYVIVHKPWGNMIVINLQGRAFMRQQLLNPFIYIDELITKIKQQVDNTIIFIDFHAETTSEKKAMGFFLDGKVSAVVGTHTHVPTADEVILPAGTAYITDVGMCGPTHSILGREIDAILRRNLTERTFPMPVAKGDLEINGVIIDINTNTSKAETITRWRKIITV